MKRLVYTLSAIACMSSSIQAASGVTTVKDNGANLILSIEGDIEKNSHVQFFIDIDNNPKTGFSRDNIKGADFLIEDNHLVKSKENSDKWNWKFVKSGLKVARDAHKSTVVVSKASLADMPWKDSIVFGFTIGDSWKASSAKFFGTTSFNLSKTSTNQNKPTPPKKGQKPQVPTHEDNTLYVDNSNGDDSFSGTSSQPFKTIQAAVNHAKKGERVFVKKGIYYEKVVVKNSGSKSSPLVIEGEKSADGKRLVTVFGGELVAAQWAVSNLGKGVYQTRDIPYASYAMTVKQDGVFKDISRLDRDMKVLGYPSDKKVTTQYTKLSVNYWDGIEALYAYQNGTTYIRFKDGANPNNMELYSSKGVVNKYGNRNIQNLPMNEGATFKIENKSYVTIKGFNIDGAQNGVLISGKDASHNMIEDNEITNGQRRVFIAKNAHHNYIKNNKMHMRLLSNFRPGAWFDGKTYKYAVAEHFYNVFKHEVGSGTFSPLDDCGVFVNGAGGENEIYANEIYDTLGGVLGEHRGKIYIHDNLMHHISSVATGLVARSTEPTYIYRNKMYDVNLGFRAQLNRPANDLKNLAKKAWFFENIIYNPAGVGSNIFFWRAKDAVKPTSASQLPHIYIYHNTFVGAGNDNNNVKDVGENILLVNNIFSGMNLRGNGYGTVAYNWFNAQSNFKGTNIVATGNKLWSVETEPTHMLAFALPQNSDAQNAGINVSKPFTIDGKSFQALPYMKNGYFKGNKPNIGAVQ